MADDLKLTINYGLATVQPEMHVRFIPPSPPTLFEIIKDYARTGMIYLSVALLIFGGSYAATKNPEAFLRGFVAGSVGYYIIRGAHR